ncbi:histidine kinase dimerization/phosphoacceptor domain -containing protein [Fibrella aquatica]|uniref:histidine kinase dimerization/phosphoacceptor domain -containing protein n=1 Tax=Fibrella aquatica TaxID=3242487 RepID=UPI003520BF5A
MPSYLYLSVFIWLAGNLSTYASPPPDSLLRNRLYSQWQAVRYSHPDSSLYLATQLNQLARKSKKDSDLAQSLMTLGIVERDRGKYAEAVILFQQALPHSERINDDNTTGSIYQSMALTYKRMGDSQRVRAIWQQALAYAEKAYALFVTHRGAPGDIANALNTMAIIQRDLERYEAVQQNYHAAIKLLEPIQQTLDQKDMGTLAILYGNLGQLMLDQGHYNKAIQLITKALAINTTINRKTSLEHNHRNLTKTYRLQKNLPASAEHARKALEYSRQIGDPHRLFNTLSVIYETYSALGDYEKAFNLLSEQKLIEDSLMRIDKARQIVALQAQYDNERTRQLAEVTAQKDRLLAETKARLLLDHEGDLARIEADKTRDLMRMSARAQLDNAILRSRYANASNQQKIRQLGEDYSRQSLQVLWLSIGACLFCLLSGLLLLLYRRIKDSRTKIQTQSEQMKLLMRELHHRVKNNLAIVSGLLELQANRLGDTPIRQAFLESQQRVQAMSLIHQRLYQTDTATQINLTDYTHSLIDSLMAAYGYSPNQLERKISIEVSDVDVDVAIPLGLILNELLTNAFKYAFPNTVTAPKLTLRIWQHEGLNLLLTDNGPGLNLHEWQAGQLPGRSASFGRRLVYSLSDQIGASLDVAVKQGTRFTLHIPTHEFQMN